MIIHCTKKILDKLRITEPQVADDIDPIYSWHVNVLKFGRRSVLLFFNDASGISVICDRPKAQDYRRLGEILEEGIRSLLPGMGISEDVISEYIKDSGETVITRTNSRVVLSRMTQYSYYIENCICNFDENSFVQLPAMIKGLKHIISEKGCYFQVRERFLECLDKRYGNRK